MNDKNKLLIISVSIAIGIVLAGFLIGKSIERFRKEDRSIAVKGFSEREVKANFAVWTIKTGITTNDLLDGSQRIEENKRKITEFLLSNGIKKYEIIQQNLNVTDKLARDYSNGDVGAYRYIIENSLQVRTAHVDLIQRVSRQTDKLLKAGVIIAGENEYNPTVKYMFTRLSEIKPKMLAEATQNAKVAALEFTKQNDVRLGKLKKANQGLFSIEDRDVAISASMGEGGYYGSSTSDIFKKVKVVVNIEYSID